MKFDVKSSQLTIKNSLNWAKIKFSIENIRTFRPLTHVNIYFKRMLKIIQKCAVTPVEGSTEQSYMVIIEEKCAAT